MANNNNIPHFTSADIEKYHKGLLSSAQMNAMEKAALDDPFLADALEGYAVAGVNAAVDIAELKRRLGERVEDDQKVIPLRTSGGSFRMWKAAAVILFVAGAGLLVYQLGFNKKNDGIAKVENKSETSVKADDTTAIPTGGNDITTTTQNAAAEVKPAVTPKGFVTTTSGSQLYDTIKQDTREVAPGKASDDLVIIPNTGEKKDQPVVTNATPVRQNNGYTANGTDNNFFKNA